VEDDSDDEEDETREWAREDRRVVHIRNGKEIELNLKERLKHASSECELETCKIIRNISAHAKH
jgi:hypothetical protein